MRLGKEDEGHGARRAGWRLVIALVPGLVLGCGPMVLETTREYSRGGALTDERIAEDGEARYELHRVFDNTILTGEGVFENENEGLARQGALTLAVADLAAKVQTEVKRNTVIYQVKDIRDVVETNIDALVQNYDIDFGGYDPGTKKYRARVSIKGERLVREIERVTQR